MDTLQHQAILALQKHSKTLSLLGILAAVVVAPISTQNFQIRNISKPLVIQTSKVEPPRIAFDEIVNSNSNEKKFSNEWNLLQQSSKVSINLNETNRMPKKISTIQLMQSRKVVLTEMSFSQQTALNEIQERRQKEIENREWISALNGTEQKRIIAAQEKSDLLNQDWTPPDLKTQTAELIQKAQEAIDSEDKSAATTNKANVQVAFTDEQGVTKTQADRSRPNVKYGSLVQNSNPQLPGGGKGFTESGYTVAGTVKLPIGGALLPGYHVQVARFEDGTPQETVQVDLKSNKYQLRVPELAGAIVAQVINAEGQVIGEGSQRISKYDIAQIHNLPLIEMKARQTATSGVLASYTGVGNTLIEDIQGQEKGVKAKVLYASYDTEGNTDEAGSFQFDQVIKGSWSLMRTDAKDYYPALFLTQAGNDKKLPLFTAKMMRALKQIVADQKLASDVPENGSIVWGQISQDGKPVAGAQVDVEFLDQYHPVYFNSFLIPDPSLKATGENGYFAFVNLPPGFHSVVATRASQYFSHGNVVVDENAISTLEVKTTIKKDLIQLKVFDAFTGNPGSAMLEMQSLSEAIEVNGITALDLPDVSRLSFLTVKPFSAQYLSTLQVYNDADEYVHVPLVSQAWIDSIRSSQKINYTPDTAMVIGFVENAEYEVYLPHSSEYSQQNRIFFDSQGQLSLTSVPGGGFILFNVPAGVQSVVVVQKQTDMINSQVIPADPGSNVVLKVRF